jgi:hypothetical protein
VGVPWKVFTACAFGAALLALIVTGLANHHLSAEVASLRQQVAATQSRDRVAIARAQSLLSAAQARLGGSHRDLITCGDLDALLNGFTTANAGNYVGLNQFLAGNSPGYTVPLPQHCLNQ